MLCQLPRRELLPELLLLLLLEPRERLAPELPLELPEERLAPELLLELPEERLAPEDPLLEEGLDAPLLRVLDEEGLLADPLRPELEEGRLAEPLRPELEEGLFADPLDLVLRGLLALPELRVVVPLDERVRVDELPCVLREGGVRRVVVLRVVVPRVDVPLLRVVVPRVVVPRVVVPRVVVPRVVERVASVDDVPRPVERTVVLVLSVDVVRVEPLATPRPVVPLTTVLVAPFRVVVRRPSLATPRPVRAPRAVACVRTFLRALSAR